jgi:C4-dicarboxylate-specific signal transduction histidine kinase
MGEMASGFAHELNQPLAAIVNYAKGAVRRVNQDVIASSELMPVLEKIAVQAERAAAIIRRIRAFIRKEEPEHAVIDLNKEIRETAGLITAEAERAGVQLTLRLDETLPRVSADAVQIEQVIVNLVRNAIEAISEANSPVRRITLSTGRVTPSAAEIAVEDTGPGLPQMGRDRLFDPFFTTKADGLGLGLSISQGIVEAHGGRLTAAPRPDGGAVFCFTLLIAEKARHDAA